MSENIKDWIAIIILGAFFCLMFSGVVYLFYLAAGWWGILIVMGLSAVA